MNTENNVFCHLPKADLHVHLNGAITTSTAIQLLGPVAAQLPEWFNLDNDLQINAPVNGLQEYFKPWYALKKLPYSKECLYSMVESALISLADDNVHYVELRNSPFNISEINQIPLEKSLEWLIEAIETASVKVGIDAKLILSLSRYGLSEEKIKKLSKAIQYVNFSSTLVGVDLSGNEDSPVIPDVEKFFKKAKEEFGLGITVHAGETGKIQNIWWAINECGADRIAHGLAAAESMTLMNEIVERKICLEICLCSNYLTRSIQKMKDHPIVEFIKQGVPFVLCSDNPSINNNNLSDNYTMFRSITGNDDCIDKMYENQNSYSFKNIKLISKLNRKTHNKANSADAKSSAAD
ncbi:MAG: hypothetical protein RBT11_10895 [Desulfobacterales bacterium]|jgi:adenosine deaminase|nr:hypothetical protein [Desulfobacterales bacterium]